METPAMNARLMLSTPLLFLATCAAAFAPAPVYKEPPKPTRSSLEQAMQGTWGRELLAKGKGGPPRGVGGRRSRVRIEGTTWRTLLSSPAGEERVGITYEMHLDARRDPPALDLKMPTSSRVMRGIVKVEGDRLTFCYTRSENEEDRPKAFTATQTESGLRVMTMTLIRADPSEIAR
jgi:uncharacterized protein (TIGR03067 family)